MSHAFLDGQPARTSGLAAFFLLAALGATPAFAAPEDDHGAALASAADLKAAIAELTAAESSFATDRNVYHHAAQRAINALEGTQGPHYQADAGSPGDATGAVGHIDALLDRQETPVWADPLRGVEANMRAAVAHLQDAAQARELMDYEVAASRALAYLEVAQGRPTESGVLAGLEGALANSVLGVPAGGSQADGCAAPVSASANAPTYGTHGGYIAWVAVPVTQGQHTLAEDPGAAEVTVQGGTIILHTAVAERVAKDCGASPQTAAATPAAAPAPQQPAAPPAAAPQQPAPAAAAPAPAASVPLPALYTKEQAEAGAQVYATKCVSCHGANLQGVAAPSVAGIDFLGTAQHNGWSLEVIRYLVFEMMPFNAPKSLSPAAYANVVAYLLASNCYPAGSKPFPTEDSPAFATMALGPVPGEHPGRNELGVCKAP
jgi:polar amino acid transport system substrate-binding protein